MGWNALWIVSVVSFSVSPEAGVDQAEPPRSTLDTTVGEVVRLKEPVCGAGPPSAQFVPLPPDVRIQRHDYSPEREHDGAAGKYDEDEPILVYSNARGQFVFPPGANARIADDVTTVAVGGCQWPDAYLSAYEILVGVAGSEGGGPAYTVRFGIHDACPHADPPGQLVPGTEGSITLDDDGDLHLIVVDLEGAEVSVDSDVWVAAEFSGNSMAGWVAGTPADKGFTRNIYDYPIPSTYCSARFGGTNLYAGFYTRLHCKGDVLTEFLAFYNPDVDGPVFFPGRGDWLADDLMLIVDDCEMSAYEIGILGTGGAFNMEAELWYDIGPDDDPRMFAIEGTHKTYRGIGDGSPEVVRFDLVDEEGNGVDVSGSDQVVLAMKFHKDTAGPIFAGEPILGDSNEMVYQHDLCEDVNGDGTPDFCDMWINWWLELGFSATVRCLGEAPQGACCDRIGDEWACQETARINCMSPWARWAQGEACDPDPFDPPCGGFACCLPEPRPQGSCENLTQDECEGLGGVWDGDSEQLCGHDGQDCGWFPCHDAEGDCCIQHESIACADFSCCNTVCDVNSWCCESSWDAVCVEEAKELCSFSCPPGEITWVEPPDDVVDARQPHPVDNGSAAQGIDTIRVAAPDQASACCWTLCETDEDLSPNFIMAVDNDGSGVYTVALDRPITAGAVTTLTYRVGDGAAETGRFTSHPANVDGDGEANTFDILALIDFLNEVGPLPWGLYSCDADRSGSCGPADILRVIDLLNGGGAFVPWHNTALPSESGICP